MQGHQTIPRIPRLPTEVKLLYTHMATQRSKRNPKKPSRYQGNAIGSELPSHLTKMKVKVYCNQLGELLTVEAKTLSQEDGQIDVDDLQNGANLFYEQDGRSYPVTVVELLPTSKDKSAIAKGRGEKKREMSSKMNVLQSAKEELQPSKKLKMLHPEDILTDSDAEADGCEEDDGSSNEPVSPAEVDVESQMEQLDSQATDQIELSGEITSQEYKEICGRLDRIENLLQKLVERPTNIHTADNTRDERFMYKGTNLLRIIARDAPAYSRRLLDVLFTKEEQFGHCLDSASEKKSKKPSLDEERVTLLFDCVKKRFKEEKNITKSVTDTLKQKLRDVKQPSDC